MRPLAARKQTKKEGKRQKHVRSNKKRKLKQVKNPKQPQQLYNKNVSYFNGKMIGDFEIN